MKEIIRKQKLCLTVNLSEQEGHSLMQGIALCNY